MNEKQKQFLKELSDLLKKHEMYIWANHGCAFHTTKNSVQDIINIPVCSFDGCNFIDSKVIDKYLKEN